MANPEHVKKLREGAEAWNAWRKKARVRPDLSGAELDGDSLEMYDLRGVDLSDATLSNVTLEGVQCDGALFDRAVFHNVVSFATTMTGCKFLDAAVRYCTFYICDFDESDFAGAILWRNVFADTSLLNTHGLESLHSESGQNSIGVETIFKSAGLPEAFLRVSGVPEEFIQYAASLAGKAIEYYSCFLSYSSKDDAFARRLYNDFQGKNIRTWFAPEDLKIGDRFRPRIDEAIRFHEKLVLILSKSSVASDWVETEVESALERERKEGRDVLFPIAIDDEGFDSQQPWAADIRRRRQIGDFRRWKSHDDYAREFEKLVRDLKKSQPPIIMRG